MFRKQKIILHLILSVFAIFCLINSAHAFEIGDLVYRKGLAGTFFSPMDPVGHVGVYIGYYGENTAAMVVEAATDSQDPPGVREVTWATFLAGEPYYGNRTTNPEPNADQRTRICLYARNRTGLPYDGNHLNQKGPLEFDCVGLAELVYEMVGLNPTPDDFETGGGWPLTPKEQYDHTFPTISLTPEIILKDSQDNKISDGGVTFSQNLTAYVTDQDHGSGLKLFKLLKDDPISGQEFIRDENHYDYDQGDFVDTSDLKWKKYNLPTNLPNGLYYIRSFDRAGNDTVHQFLLDTTPPNYLC